VLLLTSLQTSQQRAVAVAASAVAGVVVESVPMRVFVGLAGYRRHPFSPSSWASFANRPVGADPDSPPSSTPWADAQTATERQPNERQRIAPAVSLERPHSPFAVPPSAPFAFSLRPDKIAGAFAFEHFGHALAVVMQATMLSAQTETAQRTARQQQTEAKKQTKKHVPRILAAFTSWTSSSMEVAASNMSISRQWAAPKSGSSSVDVAAAGTAGGGFTVPYKCNGKNNHISNNNNSTRDRTLSVGNTARKHCRGEAATAS
jgi:hypothetical protein